MEVIETIARMLARQAEWRKSGREVGLVMTMGYLHEGHLGLVERARAENELVVTSIFVNPLQFGPKEDFGRYPRKPEQDLAMLEKAGVTTVYFPSVEEMYPTGFQTSVEVSEITEVLEGAIRPGHFRGVTTVVTKLLHAIGPQRTYFGQKDAQQVAVIQRMVRDLNFPVQVVVVPTRREPDGLAMSSRNVYLSPQEREAAPVVYRALQVAAHLWETDPTRRTGPALRAAMSEVLAQIPQARPDYVSAADPLTLQEYNGPILPGQGVLLSLAVRFGNTRLIDNLPLS